MTDKIILLTSSLKNAKQEIFLFLLENWHTFAEYSITLSRSGQVQRIFFIFSPRGLKYSHRISGQSDML
jgi:hypothetical protein